MTPSEIVDPTAQNASGKLLAYVSKTLGYTPTDVMLKSWGLETGFVQQRTRSNLTLRLTALAV